MKQTGCGRLSPPGCKDCASAAASSALPAFWRHLTAASWRLSSCKAAATASKKTASKKKNKKAAGLCCVVMHLCCSAVPAQGAQGPPLCLCRSACQFI